MIRYFALDRLHASIRSDIDAAIAATLDEGQFVLSRQVAAFESAWAEVCGVEHAVGVGSGLDALELALRALGVGAGDEVLVPSHTFIATWMGVTRAGAVPVPVDPDPQTYLLTPAAVRRAAGPRTRAVIAVDLYGMPVDGRGMAEVARDLGLLVVEDAAQAHGARYFDQPVGSLADATAWSFYPGKNLGALGDGGAVTTDDPAVAERVRSLRNYGSRGKHDHETVGANSRLDALQAAVLHVKLQHLERWNDRRREIAHAYLEAFADLPVGLPTVPPWAEPVWHAFVLTHPRRDLVLQGLQVRGVEAAVHYPTAVRAQPAYRELSDAHLPIGDWLGSHVLSLPVGPELFDAEVDAVIDAVRAVVAELGATAPSGGSRP